MADGTGTDGDALPNLHQWLPLLSESLAREGRFRWQLRGGSMRPTLPPDCQIEIAPPPQVIPLGALIVFASGSALVAHRLVYRADPFLVAQGDHRREPDSLAAPQPGAGRGRGGLSGWAPLLAWRPGACVALVVDRPGRRPVAAAPAQETCQPMTNTLTLTVAGISFAVLAPDGDVVRRAAQPLPAVSQPGASRLACPADP